MTSRHRPTGPNRRAGPNPLARQVGGAIGLITLAGLVVQYLLMVQNFAALGQGQLAAVWRFLGYFTLLTNAWVAIVMLAIATGRAYTPRAMTALTLSIMLVGIVYHLLLASTHHPVGWDWWANLVVHSIVPGLVFVYWLLFVDRARLSKRDIPAFLVWPLLFGIYSSARGALDGWYPYFFLDASVLGMPRVVLHLVGLGAAVAIAGLVMVTIGRGRRARPA